MKCSGGGRSHVAGNVWVGTRVVELAQIGGFGTSTTIEGFVEAREVFGGGTLRRRRCLR